jgi:hypothetical protein
MHILMKPLKKYMIILALLATPVLVTAQQANVNLDWAPQKNTEQLVPYGGNVISPEVKDDHTVTFRVKAPDAQKVELTGGPILLALKSKAISLSRKTARGCGH